MAKQIGVAAAFLLMVSGGWILPRPAVADEIPEELYKAMEWRLVGPYRGGRVTAVAGVPSRPHTFYMGAAGGGVWKTENAGHTWENVSDGFFNTGTIGAVAVAISDPNVVYAGTGEAPIRGVTTSHGDGVYKSTDAGETWTHLGLEATRQISKIRVHPTDPDVVWVAAQGNPWGANPERGVYKSNDGGATWKLVLEVDENTGAADLSLDATNPRVLYAAMWDHRRSPWFVRSGGPGSGLYKSTDGGDSWTKLEKGLPELVGKIGVSVSPADSRRVYAIVEAEEGGLYRSEDAGESWQRVNSTRVIQARSWYYHHVAADTEDENTVWVMNVPLMKSIDGGKTFETVSAPHGDHHDLWIHPEDHDVMINGNDGGATVTLDGGETWSSIDNQPTAQFYRVSVDNRFPYYLYGGQQDNSTMAIASRSVRGGIGRESWYPVGGGESAHIAFDPDDPRLIYATSINATVDEYDVATGAVRSIRPYPEYVFGRDARDHKYRTNWNAPVAVSPHDPEVLYYGTQVLLRSSDRGRTWEELSGDLTRDEEDKQGQGGGPITNEQAGAEFYNTLFYVAPSPHEPDTIWVGSDDGLLHVTRDGGNGWTNVTPEDAGEAHVNSIEISPHDPAAAYVAFAGYKMNDFTPRIYATANHGASWRKITAGLPEDTFARAVREDPDRRGLLYAGTETGVFVSFDDGALWQSLQLELPEVPITDLKVHDQDLIAATQGRGFWILDDLTPLHQIVDELADAEAHLFTPRDTYRLDGGEGFGGPPPFTGKNPPSGAVIHYTLKQERGEGAEPIKLEILDAVEKVIRTYASEETEADHCARDNTEPRNRKPIEVLATEAGMNRWVWDLRREQLRCVADVRLFDGWRGSRVVPGTYMARLTVDDHVSTRDFRVLADPRVETSVDDFAELDRYLLDVTNLFEEMMSGLDDLRTARARIAERVEMLDGLSDVEGHSDVDSHRETARDLIGRIDDWEGQVVQPRHETYDDDINWPNMLDVQTRFLISDADGAGAPLAEGSRSRLRDVKAMWQELRWELQAILEDGVGPFNEELQRLGLPIVYVRRVD
ncbi:MAG: glycosyl hydrolase [bacterium]|nr:glycosyl hydrolase [bacterium]